VKTITMYGGGGRGYAKWSNEESVGPDLWMVRGRELQKGDKGINESNGKQDGDTVQEKGTKRDEERKLRPRARPMWRVSGEMRERCL
jgi:hypothetical protein